MSETPPRVDEGGEPPISSLRPSGIEFQADLQTVLMEAGRDIDIFNGLLEDAIWQNMVNENDNREWENREE